MDVGCGCGHLYPLVKSFVSDYTGVDFKAMINICKKYFPNADWREGDVYNLSSLGMYDNVVAIQLFIHLPNILRPLRQCWDHTKKMLLFTVRTGSDNPSITVNKATGTIGRRYSCEELAAAINYLDDMGCIEVFLGNFSGRIMYVRLNKIEGKKCRAIPQMFDPLNIQLI